MSEAELRAFETRVLGADHAAEHAKERARIRRARRRPGRQSARVARTLMRAPSPAPAGQWGAPFTIPVSGIHAALLPTGKVMWFAYPNRNYNAESNTATAWLWDPASGTTKRVDPPLWTDPADGQRKPANIWCAGQSLLPDGRLLVTGGNLDYFKYGASDYKGLNKVYTFNPWNETWTEQPDMRHGRWYPSQVLLPDGRTVIMGGYDETGGGVDSRNTDIEIFTPSPDLDGRGTLTVLGQRDGLDGHPPNGGLYPHMLVLPSGRTLVAGPDAPDSWLLGAPGPANVFSWTDIPNLSRWRTWGNAVLQPAVGNRNGSTRVQMISGSYDGATGSSADNEVFDEANMAGGWQPAPPLNTARSHQNAVLTPDGGITVIGGGYGQVDGNTWASGPEHRVPEIRDPASGTWKLGPPQTLARSYHSTALLLPDGRILSAGDDVNNGSANTAELFSPGYLSNGARPTLTSAPAELGYNVTFTIKSPATDITRAVLMAPSAVTHAADMSQRFVELSIKRKSTGYELVSPPGPSVAPPSYYMLFVLNSKGVPSTAKWVRVR
jgi:hypothetical protein